MNKDVGKAIDVPCRGGVEEYIEGALYDLTKDILVPVVNSKTIYSEYGNISKDFECIDCIEHADSWLATIGGLFSKYHAENSDIYQGISFQDIDVAAYRPPRYGRSALVEISDDLFQRKDYPASLYKGMVDIKGCGTTSDKTPSLNKRSNGVLPITEAIQEIINKEILDKAFRKEGVSVRCLPIYGLVDLGFTVKTGYSRPQKCVVIVRQVHYRPPANIEVPDYDSVEFRVKHKIELMLRKYGLTSATTITSLKLNKVDGKVYALLDEKKVRHVPDQAWDALMTNYKLEYPQTFYVNNVQLTHPCKDNPLRACLVDFGHYTVPNNGKEGHLVTLANDTPLNWGEFVDFRSDEWVSADSTLCVNRKVLDHEMFSAAVVDWWKLTPEMKVTAPGNLREAYDIGMQYQQGLIDGYEVKERIDKFVERVI